jgi:6-pyruvoyltetrahydropterin/6-carboxytetrahydropterin synthase
MNFDYSIKVYKQYFNFACSHFLIFENGSREPLHGHNYKVAFKGHAPELKQDMVFDFLDIKPIIREICNELDHRVLIPKNHHKLRIEEDHENFKILPPDGSIFSIPKTDVLLLPITNTSAERLAQYLSEQIKDRVYKKYQFYFTEMEVEVEETPGQCAVYLSRGDK